MERKAGFNGLLVWTVLLCLVSSFAASSNGDANYKNNPTTVVKHHLQYSEEAVVETFEVDGLVIDCIDVYKQPAFEHPLLINHTIQMEPTQHPKRMSVDDHDLVGLSHPWNLPKSCPEGSIPVRRALSINDSRSGNYNPSTLTYRLRQRDQDGPRDKVHQDSVVEFYGDKFTGGRAFMNVWNPRVETGDELSASLIGFAGSDKRIALEAGWMVNPALYGDAKTRFFILWMNESSKTNCYNLKCPGFVQTNRRTILDASLEPVSVYGGPQYGIDVQIFKDQEHGNWWVLRQGETMGYWPKELMSPIEKGADVLAFGGEVYGPMSGSAAHHTSTQMGSGHFSDEGFRKSSYFRNIETVDATSYAYRQPKDREVSYMVSPNCYDLKLGTNMKGSWGYYFFYGGPGSSAASCI